MQNINEVFSDLDARIDQISNFNKQVNVWDSLKDNFNINKIKRNIIFFPNDAILRIDSTLKELKEIDVKGISIFSEQLLYDEQYQQIPQTKENQEQLEFIRKKLFDSIKLEINFYITELTTLRESLEAQNVEADTKKYSITIGADFNFPELKVQNPDVSPILSKDQLALLFYYLKESKIILPYDDSSISKLAMILSSYSENTLRQDSFRKIHDIKKVIPKSSKKSGKIKSNLEILKDTLGGIVKEIDKELKNSSPRK